MTVRLISSPFVRAAAGSAVALTGCGAGDSDGGAESSAAAQPADTTSGGSQTSAASSGAATFDKTAANGALLSGAELPGYTALPQEQISAALQQASAGGLAAMMDQVQVEPAACKSAVTDVMSSSTAYLDNPDSVALTMLAGSDKSVVTEMIGKASVVPSVTDMEKTSASCSSMTMTIQGMPVKMTMTPVKVDLGDSSTAVLSTIDMSAAGQPSQTTGSVYITGGDSTLVATQIGGAIDEASLKDLAEKAYQKAEPLLG
ncbi:hypothetical protein [Cumulibacter manganitolerans]|uniref:hypothetical protein n=1 Tax=Cumulibacter manganitolerans TaxID=1884992 RepID=UPI0012964A08|nr:hypothetical protein [Cumulibacter manganitolerans]